MLKRIIRQKNSLREIIMLIFFAGYFWHITDLHYDPFHNSPDFHKGKLSSTYLLQRHACESVYIGLNHTRFYTPSIVVSSTN